MKKFVLVVAMAAIAVLDAYAATHAKVQLWEGGPYWATTNIGAENPEDYGLYFWWGDTTGHRPSSDGTFSFNFGSDNSTIYTNGKLVSQLQSAGWITSDGILTSAHDAAHIHWGGGWRMPTRQEWVDLNTKCDWTSTTMNGVNGCVVRGRDAYASNSIFLPGTGFGIGSSSLFLGSYGYFWSSVTSSGSSAYRSGFDWSGHGTTSDGCCYGYCVRPVQGFGEEEVYTINFKANGGTGTMESQAFEGGKEQKLSKNTYRKDGYVFQGWATTLEHAMAGTVDYVDEREITINSDMTLYAVWANPALTLTAESADWSEGSITLAVRGVSASDFDGDPEVKYCDASGSVGEGSDWISPEEGEITTAWSDDGATLLVTDAKFSSRLDGIKPVAYRTESKTGRCAYSPATRNRRGIVVGVGDYEAEYKKQHGLLPLINAEGYARKFAGLACERGGFMFAPLTSIFGNDAKRERLNSAFDHVAGEVIPGDICMFYVGTHGGVDGGEGVFCLYDEDYRASSLMQKIRLFSDKNAAFIAVFSTCHSETFINQSFPNVGVIAAARAESSALGEFDEIMSYYGWDKGWAGRSETLSFGELAMYIRTVYDGLFDGIALEDEADEQCFVDSIGTQIDNVDLLSRITAGTCGCHDSATPPAEFSTIKASQGKSRDEITVSWHKVNDADAYYIFCGRDGVEAFRDYVVTNTTNYVFNSTYNRWKWMGCSSSGAPIRFKVKAFNVAGVSASSVVSGWVDNKCAIAFNAKGGTPTMWLGNLPFDGEVRGIVEKGTALGSLPSAYRDGYSFVRWSRTVGGFIEVPAVDTIVTGDMTYYADWTDMTSDYLNRYPTIVTASGGDIATAAAMTAANGCRTVGECYALGINPEDPNDDLKIIDFKMKGGKPAITINHTKDGSGNSFENRVKILGKAELTDAEWQEVPPEGNPAHRFFKVGVEMP